MIIKFDKRHLYCECCHVSVPFTSIHATCHFT